MASRTEFLTVPGPPYRPIEMKPAIRRRGTRSRELHQLSIPSCPTVSRSSESSTMSRASAGSGQLRVFSSVNSSHSPTSAMRANSDHSIAAHSARLWHPQINVACPARLRVAHHPCGAMRAGCREDVDGRRSKRAAGRRASYAGRGRRAERRRRRLPAED
jgi:hypothetical protein